MGRANREEAPMSLKVRITDTEALRALSWSAVKAYLDAAEGWQRADVIPDKAIMYQHTDETGRLREIAVLTRDDLADYAARMGDAVGALSRVEHRSELDIYEDLRTLTAELESSAVEDADPPPVTDEATRQVHKRIRQWLIEEGWHVEEVPVPPDSFNLVAVRHDGQAINIFQHKDQLDHVNLSLRWSYDSDVHQIISRLSDQEFREAVWNIYRDVSVMGVEMYGLDTPSTAMMLRMFIYFDGLTKDTLMHRVHLTNRAFQLATRTLIRALETQSRSNERALSPEELTKITRLVPSADGPLTIAS
jgi:hypothetical protein